MLATLLTVALLPDHYVKQDVEGWTLVVDRDLLSFHRDTFKVAKVELTRQLKNISLEVPPGPLAKIRQVQIWVHASNQHNICMAYHPGADWLKERGLPVEMAKCVELGTLKNFIEWTKHQPWMVLHELAHAYHERFLPQGFENAKIKAAYDAAMKSGKYDSVLLWNGTTGKHYATTNPYEYFAELSESYFGKNDFFPFQRAELKTRDPEGYSLMESIWGKQVSKSVQ